MFLSLRLAASLVNPAKKQQQSYLTFVPTFLYHLSLFHVCVAIFLWFCSPDMIDQVKTEGHKTIVDTHLYLLNPVVVLLIQYITMPKMKERKKTPNLYLSSKPILTEGKLLYAPKGNSTYHFWNVFCMPSTLFTSLHISYHLALLSALWGRCL